MKNVLRTHHAVPLVAAGALLLVALTVSLVTVNRMVESIGWVNQSFFVMSEIRRVVSLLKDAETEQRGFIIAGDDTYLTAFERTATHLGVGLENLGRALADNPRQVDRAATLRRLIDARLEQLRNAILVRQEGGLESARNLILREAGLRHMLEVRGIENEMVSEETTLLDFRRTRMSSELRMAGVTVAVSGALALGMALHTFILMRRALKALRRETELLRAKERAERADREKSEFLANMSHEIRTPMNAVLGFAELLRGLAATPKERQYVEAIHTSGKALLSLINDILDLSKIEAGKIEILLKPVSVRAVFDGIRTMFAQQALERRLQFEFEVDPAVPAALLFDATRLRQILFNVVGNALKFTREGSIRVRAWSQLNRDDETAVTLFLRVVDTGIGIPSEYHEVVFEPFRQIIIEPDNHPGGTGLGLSITRRLTEILHGQVQLESAPGEGTKFTFVFQRVAISAELPEEERMAPAEVDLGALRPSSILVADDVPLNRAMLQEFFAGTGHNLRFARTGREVVTLARQYRPDVILMDIRMPEMNGRDAQAAIRGEAALAHIPIVAVTASSLAADEQELRTIFDGFIRKPFTRAGLFNELARHLPGAAAGTVDRPSNEPSAQRPAQETIARDSAAGQKLVAQLRQFERDIWPALSRSMGYREMESFAKELLAAAAIADSDMVHDYAARLLAEVQRFEIAAQERSLQQFPVLVTRLAATFEQTA